MSYLMSIYLASYLPFAQETQETISIVTKNHRNFD